MTPKKPIIVVLLNFVAFIIAYYVSILFHEWGHGTMAWILGYKSSPFDVQYGGWLLINVDEHVNYDALMASGHNFAAGLIGIAGPVVSFIFLMACLCLLKRKSIWQDSTKLIFIYWFLIINMIPMIQYLSVSVFSIEGDTSRFVHGFHISPLWIFIPGTIFIIHVLWRILTNEIIKAYVIMPINTVLMRNILLLLSLATMFLFIYTHGYNPLSEPGLNLLSKILAIFSIGLVPILFIICNPMLNWVKKSIEAFK